MITKEECRSLAKQRLSAPRYQHTLNVSDLAVRLARFYGADETKAEIAALLHDVCKERPRAELLQMLRDNAIMTQNAAAKPQGVWHAAAAMVYAAKRLGVDDADILNAIRWHTSAHADMSTLEKIIYLADMCSAERDYPEAEKLRGLLWQGLDEALMEALRDSLRWLKEKNCVIDADSEKALLFLEQRHHLI